MSPFPLSGALPGMLEGEPVVEDLYPVTPDYTGMSSIWKTQTGSTSNLYSAVDDQSDTDYVTLQAVIPETVICGTSSEDHNFRVNIDPPSRRPLPRQTVRIRVYARYDDIDVATDESHSMDIELIEGASTQRGIDTGFSLTTSFAWYEMEMTYSEIASVVDWEDVDVKVSVTSCAGSSIPNAGDQNLEIAGIYIELDV